MNVAILDYGRGNLRSVQKAFEQEGFPATIVDTPSEVMQADRLVLPGQGAFKDCMDTLARKDLLGAVKDFLASGKPYLGLCLGLQILFEWSEEHGGSEGLGVLKGKVRRFPRPLVDSEGRVLKVPHMGWNAVEFSESEPLFRGLVSGTHFYFVHSYYVEPSDDQVACGHTTHGLRFTSAVRRGPWMATQFHPEKSQAAGLRIVRNFCTVTENELK